MFAAPTPDTGDVVTLDPQIAIDVGALDAIENLFVGLTDYDRRTSVLRPEAAIRWETNAAGDVWTFTLRDTDLYPDRQSCRSTGGKAVHPTLLGRAPLCNVTRIATWGMS